MGLLLLTSSTCGTAAASDLRGRVQAALDEIASVTGGVPKPVKKTFAEAMTKEELQQRLKGSALSGTNVPAAPDAAPVARKADLKPEPKADQTAAKAGVGSSKPGSIDPFRAMVKDLNK